MQSEGCCVQHTPPSGTIMIDGRPADHCITFDAFPEHLAGEVFPDMGTAEAIDAVATMVIGLYFERAAMQALGGKEINRKPAGWHVEIDHWRPAFCGAKITVGVLCVDRHGDRSTWLAVARDQVEQIASGAVCLVALDPVRYAARRAIKLRKYAQWARRLRRGRRLAALR